MSDRLELMQKIQDEVVGLRNSPLAVERRKNNVLPVLGEGDLHAK